MGIINANKELSVERIDCGGTFKVMLSLTAAPDITSNPTDIVLVLDRSNSMAGSALENLKDGAKAFIDIIRDATNSDPSDEIGSGSRIGIVSFASNATADTQLITSVSDLKAAVDNLSAGGSTNHAAAFTAATALLTPPSGNDRVVVMFTDGRTTAGGNPSPVASALRASGAVIYCIGLTGNSGVDENALNDWASKPAASFVVVTPNDEELEDLFEDLARNIAKPGATDISIIDRVSPCFKVLSVCMPSKGTASLLDTTSVQWRIDELGVDQQEGATLEFTVEHVGPCQNSVLPNASTEYSDDEGNVVSFPSPVLDVDCGTDVYPEVCPAPVDLAVNSCEDSLEFDAGDLGMESLGCIVQMSVRLRSVCPNKRVALAAMLSEVDDEGLEYKRGMKTMVVPAHTHDTCRDINVRCIKFVLPESLNVSGDAGTTCGARNFKARFIAHYIDHDFQCCNNVL